MQIRRRLDANKKAELWQRWKDGESISDISGALSVGFDAVSKCVSAHGGIAPLPRRRGTNALTPAEREEISRGLGREESLRRIAKRLGRPVSTISREVARNGGRLRYRSIAADEAAHTRTRRPKVCKLGLNRRLRQCVAVKLQQNWSPEQISAWLKRRFSDDERMWISHETIYRSIYIQARGVLKKELQAHLRTRRKIRRSKDARQQKGRIVDAISISERPAEIEDRAVPGHWEGDLIVGSNQSHIATLVERTSRFVMLVKVDAKDSETVVSALKKHITKLPAELRRSLTWDRGTELAQHKAFTVATDVQVYFCDPQSPWQRGTNENTNGLLRQYFPKGTDLSTHSQAHLNKVARELNDRPRKTLGFESPAERLEKVLR